PGRVRAALETAVARVRAYHERQVERGFLTREADGTAVGMRVVPLDRVGVYVPGGKAAYPSTVIMNAVPARVAGVAEIVMATPPGGTPDVVLAAARLAGVRRGRDPRRAARGRAGGGARAPGGALPAAGDRGARARGSRRRGRGAGPGRGGGGREPARSRASRDPRSRAVARGRRDPARRRRVRGELEPRARR